MKLFGQKNNFYLYPINNSINMNPLGAAFPNMNPLGAASPNMGLLGAVFPNMNPLGAASPIKGFNSIQEYDLEEVAYKQGYTNEE